MEEWKDIKGYEGLYKVSNEGNIYSIRKKHNFTLTVGSNGYISVILTKNGEKCYTSVHKLVAQAFIPNLENKPCVGHLDCDRTNNIVENLYWCTYLENNNHPITKKRNSKGHIGEKNGMYSKKPWNYGVPQTEEQKEKNRQVHTGLKYPSRRKKVIQIKEDGTIKEWENTYAPKIDGYSQGHVSSACNGKYNTIGNHKYKKSEWYFKEDYEKMLAEQAN